MSVLSDRDILRRLNPYDGSTDKFYIGIYPFDASRVQPASVDLILDNEFIRYTPADASEPVEGIIDLADAKSVDGEHFVAEEYKLYPGELVLASTRERVEIPNDIVARVEGKSSLGRLGLLIHATAGFIDPGFKGKITLEMVNLNKRPILLRAGLSICQLSFLCLSTAAEFPYGHPKLGSKYQDQETVTGSRYAG